MGALQRAHFEEMSEGSDSCCLRMKLGLRFNVRILRWLFRRTRCAIHHGQHILGAFNGLVVGAEFLEVNDFGQTVAMQDVVPERFCVRGISALKNFGDVSALRYPLWVFIHY